jgi:hypothetical protein
MLGVMCQFNNEHCQMGCVRSRSVDEICDYRRYLTWITLWYHPCCFVQAFELNIGAINEACY